MKKKRFFGLIPLVVLTVLGSAPLLQQTADLADQIDIVRKVPKSYDPTVDPQKTAELLREQTRAKGMTIGVGDKGVIALRFDDWQNDFKAKIQAELKKRELPASMALIAEFKKLPWGDQATWQDIRTWNRQGLEIWSHGIDHRDYADFKGLKANVVGSKAILEKQSLKVQGFVLPGCSKYYNPHPYGDLVDPADYDDIPGRLIRQTYAMSEAYVQGRQRAIPETNYHGLDHLTISDGLVDEAAVYAIIDDVIEKKYGQEFMIHSGNLDLPGNLSVEGFLRILDYIAAKRAAGELEVLTPSGLIFASPATTRRELLSLDFSRPYSPAPAYGTKPILDEANVKAPYRLIPGDGSLAAFPLDHLIQRHADGESWEVLVQTNAPDSTLNLEVRDDDMNLISRTTTHQVDATGLKRMVFTLPPRVDRAWLRIIPSGDSALPIYWTRIRKI